MSRLSGNKRCVYGTKRWLREKKSLARFKKCCRVSLISHPATGNVPSQQPLIRLKMQELVRKCRMQHRGREKFSFGMSATVSTRLFLQWTRSDIAWNFKAHPHRHAHAAVSDPQYSNVSTSVVVLVASDVKSSCMPLFTFSKHCKPVRWP